MLKIREVVPMAPCQNKISGYMTALIVVKSIRIFKDSAGDLSLTRNLNPAGV